MALRGPTAIAEGLEAADAEPLARIRAYLDFAAAHPTIYEAMFPMPSGLPFGGEAPEPLTRAFSAIREGFPGSDDARAEVAWSTLHGLATLRAGGRLPEPGMPARVELAHRLLTR